MHGNTKNTLRQIVGAGKVQGRVVDEPREGPKMRTNLSILGWFIKSMSLSYHPTRVSWLFREIENTWSRTTVDWSLTVFLAFPPEGTLICSWASFFLSPLINSHALRLDTSSLAKRGEEKVGAGAGEFIFTRKIFSFIFIILLRPGSKQSQTLKDDFPDFTWTWWGSQRGGCLQWEEGRWWKLGRRCALCRQSPCQISGSLIFSETHGATVIHVSFNTGSSMGYFSRIPFTSFSESHILPLPSIPCTMHICVDTTMLTEMEFWPAQRLQRFFKLTTKNSYLSTTYCIKLSSHTVNCFIIISVVDQTEGIRPGIPH